MIEPDSSHRANKMGHMGASTFARPGESPATDIVALLRARAEMNPGAAAYTFLANGETDRPDSISIGELDVRARAIAVSLSTMAEPGDRALLLYPPGLDFITAFFGCLYAAVIAVPAYPSTRRHRDRLIAVINDASPLVIMTTSDFASRSADGSTDDTVLTLAGADGHSAPGLCCTDRIPSDAAERWHPTVLEPDSLAFLQYSSGSTGDPKGVMVSHGNLLANQEAIKQSFGHGDDTVVVGWLPLYHDMGLIGNILQPLYLGSGAVLMSPMAFLEKPVRWLKAISEYRATTSGGPNFAYDLCVRKIDAEQKRDLDLTSWILAFNGSEPVRAQTMERFIRAFADTGFRRESFFPCYGLAEATLFVTGTRLPAAVPAEPDEDSAETCSETSPVSCGYTPARHDVLIIHPQTGEPLGDSEVGEIWVTGPSVAQGYWNRPDETERTFRAQLDWPSAVDGESNDSRKRPLEDFAACLRTGDLGFVSRGQLHVTGRIKELIIVRGRNYHPHDIEQALTDATDGLRPGCCAAFAVAGEDSESVVAVAEVTRETLRQKAFEPIFAAMRQRLVEALDLAATDLVLVQPGTVPKTSSGKIRRGACKQAYLDATLPIVARSGARDRSPWHDAGDARTQATLAMNPPGRGPERPRTTEACPESRGQRTSAPETGRHGEFIQRQAARVQLLRDVLDAVPPQQRTDLVSGFIRNQASRLLGMGNTALSPDSSLRSWGLDSLKLVELKHAVDQLLGIESPFALFLSDAPLIEVAEALASDPGAWNRAEHGTPCEATDSDAQPEDGNDGPKPEAFDLSFSQRAMWAVHRMESDNLGYHLHPALRTVYLMEDDHPVQRVLPSGRQSDGFELVDAVHWPESTLQSDMARRIRTPFDLTSGPIFRTTLYKQRGEASSARHTVLFRAHHIAVDLWSALILVGELRTLYEQLIEGRRPMLRGPAADYAAFVACQRHYLASSGNEKDWAYWRRQLEGQLPTLALPLDRPRPSKQDYRGASESLVLGRQGADRLRELARQRGVTLFALLLAGYKVLLHRYTRQQELIVGVPTSGRGQGRFASVVGNFVNPLPLRSHPSGDKLFTALGALAHQDFPFPLMVERLQPERSADHWPIYQTLFVLQQTQAGIDGSLAQFALGEDGARWEWGRWAARPVKIRQRVENFDLKLMAAETAEGLLFSFQYNSDLLRSATVRRLSCHFEQMLRGIATDPECPLGDLPLLPTAEYRRILIEWNATAVSMPSAGDGGLHRLVEIQVEKSPDAIAVVCNERRLTYRELNRLSNRLAHALIRAGIGPDRPVGICAHRSLELVIGLLGIMKGGGAYLPLDPEDPAGRHTAMLGDADLTLILAQPEFRDAFPGFAGAIWTLNSDLADFADHADRNPNVPVDGDMLAYVLFTSGSTGRPKGVGVPQKGVGNRLLWMQDHFRLDPTDAVLQKTPYTFDVSVWEFFWPLISGARLIMAAPGDHKEPERLVDLIERHRVTTLHFVPSMLGAFLGAADMDRCAAVRRVICSGEALSPDLRDRFFRQCDAELHNLYGPTEASIDVTAYHCERDRADASVPIGRPIANTRLYILDSRMNPAPVGVAGELFLGGVQLARGYLNRPDLTAEQFVPDPFGAAGERLYRTGDLVRYRPDGAIDYLDRIDQQVKIRGFRIELGDIEIRLRQHTKIQEAVVLVQEQSPDNKRLVAYFVSLEESIPGTDELRAWLGATLPGYMVPTAFVQLERLPVTPNGKLDRSALPAPDIGANCAGHYVAPRNATEAALTEIWAEVLRVERVGIQDNFFELGGDSILSIQAVSRATRAGYRLSPRQLFQHQTVAELARAVDDMAPTIPEHDPPPRAEQIGHESHAPFELAELEPEEIADLQQRYPDIEDVYPLAPLQDGLLFHSLLYPHSGIYLMQDRYTLTGTVDPEAIRQAWQSVVDHHPILRTSFYWHSRHRAHQIVHGPVRVPFTFFDWRDQPEQTSLNQMEEVLAEERLAGFVFTTAPLFRIRMFRFSATDYRLVRSYHHILLDEWCTSEIMSHFITNYEALIRGRPVPVRTTPPFRDYIAWLQQQDSSAAERFWCRILADFTQPTPMPIDHAIVEDGEVVGQMADAIDFLSESDTRALAALAKRLRITPNTFLQAAWALALSHHSGFDDVVFGVTVSGRPAELPGVEKILGLFINSLPLRVTIAPAQTVTEFLQQLLRHNVDMRRYEHTPLVAIQSAIGWRHDRQLFDSLLVFENAPIDQSLLENIWTLAIAFDNNRTHTNYPITVVIIPGVRLHLQITYQRRRFADSTIERLLAHFKQLLIRMIHEPASRLIDLSVLSTAERMWLDATSRGAWVAPAYSDFSTAFAAQCRRTPDKIAVTCGGQHVTYSQLQTRAEQLACGLAALGGGPDTLVALLDQRGVDLVTMIVAVYQAGGAYLPLDPYHPDPRLRQILTGSRAGLLLVGTEHSPRAQVLAASIERFQAIPFAELTAGNVGKMPAVRADPARQAYVIYTSGSTGAPKGVMVEQRGLVNNLLSKVATLALDDSDVIAQTASQCFDISVWQMLTGLICGARVAILPDSVVQDPRRLLQSLTEQGVTIFEAVPSLIRALLEVGTADSKLPTLRWLLPTGEAFPPELCRLWMARYPAVRLLNAYGPAECSDDVAYFPITEQPLVTNVAMPIGRPLDNLRLYIVDRWLRPVAAGIPGELCVAGIGVGRGYLNRPDLTAERFVPDPFAQDPGERMYRTGDLARFRADGVIDFLGRIDTQVKIRGYRVEPGEIEAHLLRHPQVEQAVVVARRDAGGNACLVAYLVGADAEIPAAENVQLMEQMRAFLKQTLPDYMVSSLFVRLERMPLTANGKIALNALPTPVLNEHARHEHVAPRNDAEQHLTAIWHQALGVGRVGVTDNFFDLGGHSLLAMQILSRTRALFGVDLELRSLFDRPTVEQLALLVEDAIIHKLEALSDEEVDALLAADRYAPRSP